MQHSKRCFSNPFIVKEHQSDNNEDPDLNFFHDSVSSSLDTDYVSPKDFKSKAKFKGQTQNSFFVLHLNVYKLNILNVAIFMCKVSHKTTPNIFLSAFQKPSSNLSYLPWLFGTAWTVL